jgi:hypothetical protein
MWREGAPSPRPRKVRQKKFVIDGEAVILGVDSVCDFNALHAEGRVALAAPVPALVFQMPFAGLRQACRFVFVAERYPPSAWKMTHQRSFLSH